MTRLTIWCQRLAQRTGLTGAAAGVFLGAPLVAWIAGWNVGNAVVFGTGVVVLAYTYETYQIRQQMVRQTGEMQAQRELQIRPFVVIDFERTPSYPIHLVLRNIGHGTALGVSCSLFRIEMDPATSKERKREEECERIDVLAGHESRSLISRDWESGEPFPVKGLSQETFEATITYKNIEGSSYKSHLRLGPDGYEVLKS
jgi:hypothetical protein